MKSSFLIAKRVPFCDTHLRLDEWVFLLRIASSSPIRLPTPIFLILRLLMWAPEWYLAPRSKHFTCFISRRCVVSSCSTYRRLASNWPALTRYMNDYGSPYLNTVWPYLNSWGLKKYVIFCRATLGQSLKTHVFCFKKLISSLSHFCCIRPKACLKSLPLSTAKWVSSTQMMVAAHGLYDIRANSPKLAPCVKCGDTMLKSCNESSSSRFLSAIFHLAARSLSFVLGCPGLLILVCITSYYFYRFLLSISALCRRAYIRFLSGTYTAHLPFKMT